MKQFTCLQSIVDINEHLTLIGYLYSIITMEKKYIFVVWSGKRARRFEYYMCVEPRIVYSYDESGRYVMNKLSDDFSASGSIYRSPSPNTRCGISWGQCLDRLPADLQANIHPKMSYIFELWSKYHLKSIDDIPHRGMEKINELISGDTEEKIKITVSDELMDKIDKHLGI